MRKALLVLSLAATATRLPAQTLRDQIGDLFRFGSGCNVSVCLDVGSGHGAHYNPAVVTGGVNLIGLITDAIGISVANLPLSAASGGAIWARGRNGLPVRTATSSGPIFAERGQTLGRGRVLVSAPVTRLDYRALRGVPLSGLVFTFPHQDVGDDGHGVPDFESDVIEVRTDLRLAVTAITPVLSYGVTDKLDVSVAIPLVSASLSGTSEAQIVPFSNPTPHHFGTAANPQLRATSAADGSAMGIGDIALRVKAAVVSNPNSTLAILGDVRLPTGKQEDFLGAGGASYSVMGIGSLRRGAFSPHVNAGVQHRGGASKTTAVLATAGFDHLMTRNVTLALDVITSWQVGESSLEFPEPVTISALVGPSAAVRVIRPINVPDRRDHLASGSIGAKFGLKPGLNFVTNALVPLRQGGLQPNFAWTGGLEYSF